MSALRGRKYTMLSDISLARRKISNVTVVKDKNQYLLSMTTVQVFKTILLQAAFLIEWSSFYNVFSAGTHLAQSAYTLETVKQLRNKSYLLYHQLGLDCLCIKGYPSGSIMVLMSNTSAVR